MEESRVREILERAGAVITQDHFVYNSSRHGPDYVNKDAVYPDTEATDELCQGIAERFCGDNVEVVVAPAVGGVILSQGVARHLTKMTGQKVLGIYADKEGEDALVIRRGYDQFVPDKRVLVVDDVLTTGGSARRLVELIRNLGGFVVGVGVLCNRGNVQPSGVGDPPPRLEALINVQMLTYPEGECPLCDQGVPINTKIGEGSKYLARKAGTA